MSNQVTRSEPKTPDFESIRSDPWFGVSEPIFGSTVAQIKSDQIVSSATLVEFVVNTTPPLNHDFIIPSGNFKLVQKILYCQSRTDSVEVYC